MRAVYVLVRIPKTGSSSLTGVVRDSLPNARHFGMPHSPHPSDGRPWGERLRATRSRVRTLAERYRAVTFAQAWRHVEAHASDGDLISGHIRYGDPALPSFQLNYITLLRDPLGRALSNYNYCRLGYQKRNALRRGYVGGDVRAAGRYSFSGYISYLAERTRGDANVMWAFSIGDREVADPLDFLRANYFHFGVVEHFDLFAAGLGRKLGVQARPRKLNVTPQRVADALPAADKRLFERLFSRDIALYHAALAHLDRRDS